LDNSDGFLNPENMDFTYVMDHIVKELDHAKIKYALIGGFAIALRGIQRATVDLDFILMLEDLDRADAVFTDAGYKCAFRSENVSHYISNDQALGRIDILHAFRGPSLSMLGRAERIAVTPNTSIPVVEVEDLIGLKIQAACNDPQRTLSDWSDIQLLVQASAKSSRPIDWDLISDYLELFDQSDKLSSIKDWYGTAHGQ
jgi:hypothetical protein